MFRALLMIALAVGGGAVAPAPSQAAVLFSESFNSQSQWGPLQFTNGATNSCVKGAATCVTPVPTGFSDYRIAATEACSNLDGFHNTLNINATHPRGGTGKSFVLWSEPCYSSGGSWGSDGLLGVSFAGQSQVYIRYWILFPTDWKWNNAASPMQKFIHLSHYDPGNPASVWDFFSGTQNKPRYVGGFAKYGSGTYRTQLYMMPSPLTTERDNSNSSTTNDYLGAAPMDWYNAGAPGDGRWHSLEWYVKLNSSGGVADGTARFWFDGALVHDQRNIAWVSAGEDPGAWLWNHTWIGGNNSNTYLPANEQWYAVDDFVVSTHYSGPPPPPTTLRAEGVSTSSIRLTWQSGSNGANYLVDGYRIYYGTDPGNLNSSVTVAASQREAVVTSLANGTKYYFAVTAFKQEANDANENESLRSASANAVTVDLVRPDVTLLPVTTPTRIATQTLSGTVADAGGIASVLVKVGAAAPVAATVSGNNWNCTIQSLTEGGNSVVVTAQDLSGNESSASGTIMLDTHPPVVTVSAFTTQTIFTSLPISGTVSDVGGSGVTSVMVQVGNGVKSAADLYNSAWNYLLSNLQPGVANQVLITARDAAGNESSQATAAMASIGVLKAGDLSGDASVGVEDAQLAMQMGTGMKKPDATQLQRGDLAPMAGGVPQSDGVIDTGDAVVILGIVTGMVRF